MLTLVSPSFFENLLTSWYKKILWLYLVLPWLNPGIGHFFKEGPNFKFSM